MHLPTGEIKTITSLDPFVGCRNLGSPIDILLRQRPLSLDPTLSGPDVAFLGFLIRASPQVLYETPRVKTAGVYVLNCGATEKYQGLSDGPFFVMKVGRSDNIPQRIVKHNSSRGDFAVSGAKFLFGLKMAIKDTKKAELLLHASGAKFLFGLKMAIKDTKKAERLLHAKKLTQLGFARPL